MKFICFYNYRYSFIETQISKPLVPIDGTAFPLFRAVDDDGGIFGEVSFEIESTLANSDDADHFNLLQVDAKTTQLYVQLPIQAKLYHVIISNQYTTHNSPQNKRHFSTSPISVECAMHGWRRSYFRMDK